MTCIDQSLNRKLLAVLIGTTALSACTPALNWRDVRDARFGAAQWQMPCKPEMASRKIPLAGLAGVTQPVDFALAACQTLGLTFSFGAATLPDAALAASAPAWLRDTLALNLGGKPLDAKPQTIKNATFVGERFSALGVATSGTKGTKDARAMDMGMRALVFSHGNMAYQAVVSGPPDKLRVPAVDEYLASVSVSK